MLTIIRNIFGSSIATHKQDEVDSIFEAMVSEENRSPFEDEAMPVALTLTKAELLTVLNALVAVHRVLNCRKFRGSDAVQKTVDSVLRRGLDRLYNGQAATAWNRSLTA